MKSQNFFLLIAISTIAVCAGCSDGKPRGIPEATATVEQVTADATGYYAGKDLAVTGQVSSVQGGTVTLGTPGATIECYMTGEGRAPVGTTVTIRGRCIPGDHGITLDKAFLIEP